MCAVAALAVQALYFSPGGLFLYAKGLQQVNADHNPNYVVFLAGQLRRHFTQYFAVAYLLKEPLASIGLVAAGAVLLLRRRDFPISDKGFLLLPPAVFFVAHTIWADDAGFRYLIPALPFLFLIGGIALARLLEWGFRGRAAAALLCGWILVEAAGIYPDHLSYFNEAACLATRPAAIGLDGGTRCGVEWMDDSNVDWGQGLKQLKGWLDVHAAGRSVSVGYFGSFPLDAYGIRGHRLEVAELLRAPAPGLYAVSAHYVARLPALARAQGGVDWLRGRAPVAIVGHSIYIFDVPPPL
jgi:hypothetical protein